MLTRWGSNACLNQWLKPHSLCYRHQPNLQWLWRFHRIISRRLKWIFRRFYPWIKKMGNVLMSCYFSVLILAICKKCRLVLASGHLHPRVKQKKMSPLQSQKRNETSAHFQSPISKGKGLVSCWHWRNWLGNIFLSWESATGFGIETVFKWLLLGTSTKKKNTCTQRNRWRKEDCFKLDLHFVLQFKICRIKSMTKFFFNDTATTEIYTILFVGSVRCV